MGSIVSKFLVYFHEWKSQQVSDSSILSLKEYLNICSLENIKNLKPSNLKICCGNQSADMDSVMSVVIYSYYNYLYNAKVILPVINIPREDLKLRKDILNLLEKVGINKDTETKKSPLIFIEDIKQLKKVSKCTVDAILVDHNEPQGVAIDTIDKVIGIIDHHEDTNSYDKELIESLGNPLIIKTCGSCTSLITNYWMPKLQSTKVNSTVLKLGLAAVLLDTSNFKSKVESPDLEALVYYKNALSATFDFKFFFKELKSDKSDLEGFDMFDLLRKDFKLFEFSGYRIGMASLGESMESFIGKFGVDSIKEACNKYYRLNSMDILLLLTSYSDSKKNHKRQIIFYSGENVELETKIVSAIKEDLELVELNDIHELSAYQQNKDTASRKQIAPIVGKALGNI
ncbi:DHH phosphoesterase [Hanseniaspora valbyensis NRRL Y-1626]|uniref:DHH phosphoesterase n=1 Tax=Hanseniaspora valbyensis NRRL Y-1626 TaxID=766949 RepID=A0A1B7T823_9ASCO|nr:DHH phosphoesterase [Hanseniaspora valbyensis NRRL Y-1626]